MALHKTHFFIAPVSSIEGGKTACGIEAWESSFVASEADTADGRRLEITRRVRDVTCEACLKARPVQTL